MAQPKHKRMRLTPMAPEDQLLRVRIVGPTKVFVTEDVHSIKLNLFDGVMQINRRYSSVIEKVKEGEIKLKLASPADNGSMEKRFNISSGWVIVAHNLCEILVKKCKEVV